MEKTIISQEELDRLVAEGITKFNNCDFTNIHFGESHSAITEITNSEFFTSYFTEFNGDNIIMRGNDLASIAIVKSSFKNANFENSRLVWSGIEGSNLENARFTDANLLNITFEYTNLKGVVFEKAILRNTAFWNETDLANLNLTNATFDTIKVRRIPASNAPLKLDDITFTTIKNSKELENYKKQLPSYRRTGKKRNSGEAR